MQITRTPFFLREHAFLDEQLNTLVSGNPRRTRRRDTLRHFWHNRRLFQPIHTKHQSKHSVSPSCPRISMRVRVRLSVRKLHAQRLRDTFRNPQFSALPLPPHFTMTAVSFRPFWAWLSRRPIVPVPVPDSCSPAEGSEYAPEYRPPYDRLLGV